MHTRYVIVIPVYNNNLFIGRSLLSAAQWHDDYRIIVSDDASTDGTWDIIQSFKAHQNHIIRRGGPHGWDGADSRVVIRRNETRLGVVGNHYEISKLVDDDEVIVVLDGDDHLYDRNVLTRLDEEYDDPNVWLTYGSFGYDELSRNPDLNADWRGFATKSWKEMNRHHPFTFTHLRTYKGWLFKSIKKEDLMFEGEFYKWLCDHVTMYPMLEMAGPQHIRFIHDILYWYNGTSMSNEHKLFNHDAEAARVLEYFKSQPIYSRVEAPK